MNRSDPAARLVRYPGYRTQSKATALKIIFLNRYFYPDHSATSQMLSGLAFALAERGHRIVVIASRQLYDCPSKHLPDHEIIDGVEVHRVWTSRFGRHNLIGRAIDYISFYLSAGWRLWRLTRRGNVVIAKTDPPMLSVFTAPIAAMRQAHLVNWLQDVFPEVAEALGVGRMRIAYVAMRSLRNWSLRRARMNVAIGERMAKLLEILRVPRDHIRVISNWADGILIRPLEHSMNSLRREWGLEGKFVVGYSGNLGHAHEFATLLEAIASLETRAEATPTENCDCDTESDATGSVYEIAWLFIGGGALHKQFEHEVYASGLKSVMFRPYQPRERLSESLSAADVRLVSLRPELEGLIVPSKFYGIAAAGRPTLFIGDEDGEIARILAAERCGWTIKPGDGAGLAERIQCLASDLALTRQAGLRARSAFERRFDFPIVLAAWEALLEELGAPTHVRGQTASENRLAPEERSPVKKA